MKKLLKIIIVKEINNFNLEAKEDDLNEIIMNSDDENKIEDNVKIINFPFFQSRNQQGIKKEIFSFSIKIEK